MRESSKTNAVRGKDFFDRYLSGKVIDIGCAEDPVCPAAERFDIADGDANDIAAFRPQLAYDTVYSSHCLEHMHDVRSALRGWWALVKAGGHMIVVVPHEDLYEQGFWPSIFNLDHKASFRLGGETSWSPVSYDIRKLMEELPDAMVLSSQKQDQGYDYRLMGRGRGDKPLLRKFVFQFTRMINRLGPLGLAISHKVNLFLFWLGCPVDQTMGNALAQIEVIVRKN
ncbi:MAG: methyltransferase domain-containing protein [Sulfuritalea sp.]|nr:methyltransferase domain-containing protein [Sulfuritalea sp.]